jgi:MarR family transcriptional regulator, organic hydroperoxide resistance regulator
MKQAGGNIIGGPSLPPLGEVLDFMRLIWQMDHAAQRTSKRMEATLGVTSPQRLVIRIVGRFPGIPAGYLARLLHIHPSTLTGVLGRIERQGLLRRRSDPQPDRQGPACERRHGRDRRGGDTAGLRPRNASQYRSHSRGVVAYRRSSW